MNIGIITGSGFYDFPELEAASIEQISTPFGESELTSATLGDHTLHFIARHGDNHSKLPNMINYRAHIAALNKMNVQTIIGTSVMGILESTVPMAELYLFKDLFFVDNRLPNGEICTMFAEEGEANRGHYIFGTPFSIKGNEIAQEVAMEEKISVNSDLIHGHANGPRFNSKTEITLFRQMGCHTVSQTVGPEIILAGECEIPYILLGYGIDYANGVQDVPTPIEVLNENMGKSKDVLTRMILGIAKKLSNNEANLFDNGFVYRFQ